ncbi:MAG: ABC transporter substrate-binding protein [Tannerellaceae bacterium]|nr:ABC transporter substrate-binding protein [Tannerellaceae bacterium]
MKKKLLYSLICLLSLLITGIFPGCQHSSEDTIWIGAILPLSGSSAVIGEPKKRALDVSLEEFNNQHDIKIEILFEDSKGTFRDGITAFQKLLNNKNIHYYYIDLTPIVNSCVPLVNEHNVITFAGSAEPEITQQSDYLFRLFAGGDQEISLMIDALKAENANEIYILHTNELYGINAYKFLEKEFVAQGGVVVGHEEYPMNNTDFKAVLTKAKSANPQKYILLGYGNEYAPLLKQAIEMSIRPEDIICNLGGSNKSVIDLPVEFTNGLTFIGPRFTYLMMNDKLEPEMAKFVDRYTAKYNELPDFRAAYTYDVINILMSIWKDHKTDIRDVEKMRNHLLQIRNFRGASGNISFYPNGDTRTDLVIAQYQNSQIVINE